jgi:hypothetical protein
LRGSLAAPCSITIDRRHDRVARRDALLNEFSERDLAYVIRLDEIAWGGLLLALTIAIHGAAMLQILRVSFMLTERTRSRTPSLWMRLGILIVAVWMIVFVHLVEIVIWSAFFVWNEAQPNIFSAFYHAMLNYTTLQAGYLPVRWRLLEGMLGIAGLLTFAWSTSVLLSLVPKLAEAALQSVRQQRETGS